MTPEPSTPPALLAPEQLREIEEREKRASVGPWSTTATPGQRDYWGEVDDVCYDIENGDNAIFIAHARTDIPALLRHISAQDAKLAAQDQLLREADERIERLNKDLDYYDDYDD